RRGSARGRLPVDLLHAVLLLQRLRRLAVQGEIEALVGDAGRRLFRAFLVGIGGLRLAVDHTGQPGELLGLRGSVRQRRADAFQLQSALEAGRLLPAERLAGGAQPPAASWGLRQEPAALAAVGRGAAGAGYPGTYSARVWFGELVLFADVSRTVVGPDDALFRREIGRAGIGSRWVPGAIEYTRPISRLHCRGGPKHDPLSTQTGCHLGRAPRGRARRIILHPKGGPGQWAVQPSIRGACRAASARGRFR